MSRQWEILGASFDCGSCHKGSGKAPAAIRDAGLTRRLRHFNTQGFDVADGGDIESPVLSGLEKAPTGLRAMTEFAPAFMARLGATLSSGRVPLVLGGDHSLSIPGVSAVVEHVRQSHGPGASVGLIWVDAHPDLETPGPDSTNDLNAMAAAHLLDLGVEDLRTLGGFAPKVKPEHLIYIGLRDVVSEEREIIRDRRIRAYTMSDIERLGIVQVCKETFAHVSEETDAFVLSFDVDALDPLVAPDVDYPEPGGLTLREAMVIMEYAHQSQRLALFELLEANPTTDRDQETAKVAVRLLHRLICGPIV